MRVRALSGLCRTRKLLCELFNSHKTSAITYSQLKQSKLYSTDNKKIFANNENVDEEGSHNLAGAINTKYKVFRDEDSQVVFDIEEEQRKISLQELNIDSEYHDPYKGINLQRGETGVFDIQDLVLLLEKDNAKNIFVASVPPECSYVDYIVVVTAKSRKHMTALAAFVRKVYKLKKHETDLVPRVEGKNSSDWVALDLGNIALHIFTRSARILYDLETLWSLGPEFDSEINESLETYTMDQYNEFLSNFTPADENETTNKELKNDVN